MRKKMKKQGMKQSELHEKAKKVGINPDGMASADLIRTIQKAEGYTPCFGSGTSACPYTDCCFRADCVLQA